MGKIILTEELRNVLNQIDNLLSKILLEDDINDDYLLKTDKPINYLDLSHSNKGHLSYLTKDRIDKIEQDDKDYWKIKMRYHGRPGSVFKKLFDPKLYYLLEDFSMKYLSIVDKPIYRMEIVKGNDISKYYHYRNYYNHSGSLGSSCMSHSPSEYFDIYAKNEDNINMLVMLDQYDKVMGRAIVWVGNGFRVMDRIYVCNDLYEMYFRQWAKDNDVYQKEFNNFRTPLNMISPDGEKTFKEFIIELNQGTFERYPYLDTFKWLNKKENKIYNYIPTNLTDDFITLSDSMGGYLNKEFFMFDDLTKEIHCKTEIYYVDYLDKNIFLGNLVHSHVLGRFIYMTNVKRLEEIRDYIFNDEYDHLNDYDKIEARKKEIEQKKLNGISNLRSLIDKIEQTPCDQVDVWDGYDYPTDSSFIRIDVGLDAG